MGVFFLGGVYFFIRGAERDSLVSLVASGVLMGLNIVTKYPGVMVLPLTGIWFFMRWKKLTRRWIYAIPWAIALSFLLGYSAYTARLYGSPHILAASARMVHVYGYAKVLAFFVFFAGAIVIPLVAWPAMGARVSLWGALASFTLAVFFHSSVGGFSPAQSSLLGLWFVTGWLFLGLFWRFRAHWVYPRDYFLISWVLLFIVMMLVVMGWVAGRYYVIVVPAVAILAVRVVEVRWPGSARRLLAGMLAGLMALGGALAYADYQQANVTRWLIEDLRAQGMRGGPSHYYLGDSFTVSYLKREGWIPCFPKTVFQPGDLILAKEITMPSIWFWKSAVPVRPVEAFDYATRFPIKVMDNEGSAGFYASVWGALPFTISPSPWERFVLLEVVPRLRSDPSGSGRASR